MSWLRGYSKPSSSAEDSREEKRRNLEAEREARAKNRQKLQKQLAAAQEAQQEADQILQQFLEIDPDIFEGPADDIEVSEDILDQIDAEMAEAFDVENGTDGDKDIPH